VHSILVSEYVEASITQGDFAKVTLLTSLMIAGNFSPVMTTLLVASSKVNDFMAPTDCS
jgi:hypothetical protein